MSPETRSFSENAELPFIHDIANALGMEMARSPLNLSFVVALLACVGVWVLIWRSRLGYAIRATGHSTKAAEYAGIPVSTIIIVTMAISGGLAGMMAINEILGVQHRTILGFTSGYGFTGIAVALMGRNHPVGIVLASLLFGALYQGGAELDFEFSTITREMVLLIQGLIILFSGGLAYMFNRPLAHLLGRLLSQRGRDSHRGAEAEWLTCGQFLLTIDATFRVATPLFSARWRAFFEESGVIDISLEGKMLMSAFVAAAVATLTSSRWPACSPPSASPSCSACFTGWPQSRCAATG